MATKIELRSILATPITHKLSSRPKKTKPKKPIPASRPMKHTIDH